MLLELTFAFYLHLQEKEMLMDVMIQGHNMKITDGIEAYAQTKIDKLDRYLPNITEIRIDISRKNTHRGANITSVQITLRHERGAILRSEEKIAGDDRDSLYAGINQAIDKIYKQIRRFKDKSRNKRRKEYQRYVATIEELALAEDTPDVEDIETRDGTAPEEEEILRRKEVEVTAMTEAEAIAQMELLGHDFFMFFNADTNGVNVLYKRSSGGYGVLVPHTG